MTKNSDKKEKSFRDIENLKIRTSKLIKHLEKNKHDYSTKRTLMIKRAKLKKLEEYIKSHN